MNGKTVARCSGTYRRKRGPNKKLKPCECGNAIREVKDWHIRECDECRRLRMELDARRQRPPSGELEPEPYPLHLYKIRMGMCS